MTDVLPQPRTNALITDMIDGLLPFSPNVSHLYRVYLGKKGYQ